METQRELSERDLQDPALRVKGAVRRLVKLHGGIDAAAAECGMSRSSIGLYVNPNVPDQARVDVVFCLERAINDPVVTRELAAMHGFMLEPMEPAELPADDYASDPLPDCIDSTYDVAELGHLLKAAADRGQITAEEADRFKDKARKALDRFVRLHDKLHRIGALIRKARRPLSLRRRQHGGV
ncbi:phage regulatory CII family protein [Azospirillum sp.]|uniref:phage regulatory CII family protein n=1 Tax=Azospirillum sp. TaxID=34012 RepID=UPI003D70ED12